MGERLAADPIYAAIQSLGLRLAAGKGKLDAVIIDHVEKPTTD